MTVKERYARVLEWLEGAMPVAETELHYDSPFQLLVAVILSAQCTDKRVNMVTPPLFEALPTPGSMAAATPADIFPYIRSVSYPNNKAKSLAGMARKLVEDFGGEVPSDMDALLTLPGVGRKTANVILAVVYDRAAMAVGAHVFRVRERIGLATNPRTQLTTDRALRRPIPAEIVPKAHHWLIQHGRYVCKARRPDCLNCGLTPWCRYYLRNTRRTDK